MKIITITMLLWGALCVDFGAEASRTVTRQTVRDHIETQKRIVLCGAAFAPMANLLKSYYKTQLILVANSYADANGLERPDRVTHRNKNAMVCWFVLNAPDFPLGFPPIPTGNRRSVPAAASVVPAAATAAAPAQTNNTDWNLDEGWHLDESWNLDEGWNFDEGWNLDESWTLNNADTTD